MLDNFVVEKSKGVELSREKYYEAVKYLCKHKIDFVTRRFFVGLNSFGMTKKEVLYLANAMRDSGKVLKYNRTIFEKHSTGGVADSTSLVIIPLLASLGYKIIKTSARSFSFTNGSADRFNSIPGFSMHLTNSQIQDCLTKNNACVLAHSNDFCPADKILFDLREKCGLENDLNLLVASIASKKMASGANVVLVDVKFGDASIVKSYKDAKYVAKLLKYIFIQNNIKSVIVISNTNQTIGEGVGNAVEVEDAIAVLKGKKNMLRDVSIKYASELILQANKYIRKKDLQTMLSTALNNGTAYKKFLDIVAYQGGDVQACVKGTIFKPYKTANFVAERDGYVGHINSLLLGELVRRLCADSHDNNIGAMLRVKIGDFIKKGDAILTFYYKDSKDLIDYSKAISGCVRVTDNKIRPVKVIKRILR